ncbi:putative epoxide hydrolase [Mycobacterium xenopi 3993]|nr:putative epoxide hydrolase [Mycobacterium xenopi 3993]
MPPTQALRKLFGDKFFYMLYFQEPGRRRRVGADPAKTIRRMMPACAAAATRRRAADGRPGPEGFVERLPSLTACPLDQRRRTRPLHRRVHPHRFTVG